MPERQPSTRRCASVNLATLAVLPLRPTCARDTGFLPGLSITVLRPHVPELSSHRRQRSWVLAAAGEIPSPVYRMGRLR